MKTETMTLVLVNLAGIMERADESLLPGVYKEVGAALHTDPTGLGSLTLFRSIVQSSCYPIAAYLAVHHNRAHVIALGAFLWAAATFLVAFSSTFFQRGKVCSSQWCSFVLYLMVNIHAFSPCALHTPSTNGVLPPGFSPCSSFPGWATPDHDSRDHALKVAVSRALNGIGLAIVAPAIQSLVADSTDDTNRGMAFGWLQLTSNLGSILGGLLSLLIAPITFMGIPGWRISFHLVGIISVVVGILVRLFANDPHFLDNSAKPSDQVSSKSLWSEVKDLVLEAKSVIKIQSFQIIVAQGVTGSFPWSALSFAPMWLELMGFSHEKTAFLIALFVIASSLGGLFGGRMGDFLSTRFPDSGRIILAQISSASAIPLAAILLLVLPDDPTSMFVHGLVMVIMGLCISWNAPATNNPIFAEIVPEKSRTSVYALDRSFESILSSFAPPVVGILAQHVYGYKPLPEGSSLSEEIATDRGNAASLAKALYTAIGIPMALCCLIYAFLYRTYPRDKKRAKMEALIESEMQQLESCDLLADEVYTQVQFPESDLPYIQDRTVVEVDYKEEDGLDLDDNDEKKLLYRQLTFSNLGE
ncbi:hypothetical protein JRO89_XS07G0144200 [Xanthoceras sorbifolium]|uniref:Major facilitator superfamily (MFS) profile domain-containing protein n=1 Tax=Xanthoceras sorbifolium TaxID=99658 RepID=A0ABQ8HTX4_9ROSI|nr:hypothetical protein JRO89_XS07G0144200 [Xanthoceras sorbifolium]